MKIPILVFSFFLLLNTAFAQLNDASPGANQYYQEAEIALLEHDYRKAIRLFEKAVKANPDLLAAHRALGICYELVNELDKALESSKKVRFFPGHCIMIMQISITNWAILIPPCIIFTLFRNCKNNPLKSLVQEVPAKLKQKANTSNAFRMTYGLV